MSSSICTLGIDCTYDREKKKVTGLRGHSRRRHAGRYTLTYTKAKSNKVAVVNRENDRISCPECDTHEHHLDALQKHVKTVHQWENVRVDVEHVPYIEEAAAAPRPPSPSQTLRGNSDDYGPGTLPRKRKAPDQPLPSHTPQGSEDDDAPAAPPPKRKAPARRLPLQTDSESEDDDAPAAPPRKRRAPAGRLPAPPPGSPREPPGTDAHGSHSGPTMHTPEDEREEESGGERADGLDDQSHDDGNDDPNERDDGPTDWWAVDSESESESDPEQNVDRPNDDDDYLHQSADEQDQGEDEADDEADNEPEEPTSDLMYHQLLYAVGATINTKELIVICSTCQHAVLPSAIVNHAHKEHDMPIPKADVQENLQQLLRDQNIHQTTAVREPEFGKEPVQGLRRKNGHFCRECSYAAPQLSSIQRHWSTPGHKARVAASGGYNVSAEFGIKKAVVQSFFWPGNQAWFVVNPDLQDVQPGDPFAEYVATYLARLPAAPTRRSGPVNGRDVSPMEKLTNWGAHLERYMAEPKGGNALYQLLHSPAHRKKHAGTGLQLLPNVAYMYLHKIGEVNTTEKLHARSVLMDYPLTNNHGRVWKHHTDPATLSAYASRLYRFTLAILVSVNTTYPTEYRFPLSQIEKDAAKHLWAELRKKVPDATDEKEVFLEELVKELHSFVALFLIVREGPNEAPEPSQGKFDCVLECLCALDAIREDLLLQPAHAMTQVFANLKYLVRGTLLYESKKRVTPDDRHGRKAIDALASSNIAVDNDSPFNMVLDYQRATSAIVFSTVRPPNLRVSDDCTQFTHGTITLDLPLYKLGLRKGTKLMAKRLRALMYGPMIKIQKPEIFRDDWTKDTQGYSFLQEHTFTKGERPWLKRLLSMPELGLLQTDAQGNVCKDKNGDLVWNHGKLWDIMRLDDAFLRIAMAVIYMTGVGSRGQEFMDARLVNGHRQRGVFVDTDGSMWMVPQRLKTEGTDGEGGLPASMLTEEVGDMLLTYIAVVRPAIVELSHVLFGKQGSEIHSDFLWASCGKLLDGDDLSKSMRWVGTHLCKVQGSLGPRALRQFYVEIERVYLGSELQMLEDQGVDIFAAKMAHSVSTARKHYGKTQGQYLPSDLLSRFRKASHTQHQLLGLIDGAEEIRPVAFRLLGERFPERLGPAQPAGAAAGVALNPSEDALVARISANVGAQVQALSAQVQALGGQVQALRDEMRSEVVDAVVEANSRAMGPATRGETSAGVSATASRSGPTEAIVVPVRADPAPRPPPGMVAVDGLQLVGELLDIDSPRWRSEQQAEAVRLALERGKTFFAILNTGDGKSMAYQVAALHERNAAERAETDSPVTISLFPTRTLLDDQLESCAKLGLSAVRWLAQEGITLPDNVDVICVALETLVGDTFERFLTHNKSRIARVFVDEGQNFVCERKWRPDWCKLVKLCCRSHQVIWSSATMALRWTPRFMELAGLPETTTVIRSNFAQPNLRFFKVELDPQITHDVEAFIRRVQAFLRVSFMGDSGQGIVFRKSINEVLGHFEEPELACISFASWKLRSEHEAAWLDGIEPWIMTTSTCVQGVSNRRCNVVLFVDFPPSLIHFAQGAGRAGRDGQESLVVFITMKGAWMPGPSSVEDFECFTEGRELLNSTGLCRRHQFGIAFNGAPQACADVPGAALCDVCDPGHELLCGIRNRAPAPLAWEDEEMPLAECDLPAEAPCSTPTTAAVFYAPGPGPVVPSVSLLMDAATFVRRKRAWDDKMEELAWLSRQLPGHCVVCWALTGQLLSNGHEAFKGCSGAGTRRWALGDLEKGFDRGAVFDEFQACGLCGFPQGDVFVKAGHPAPAAGGFSCPHPGAMRRILWTIRKTPELWEAARKEFDLLADIGAQRLGQWAVRQTGLSKEQFNAADMMAWLVEYHDQRRGTGPA